MSLERDQARLLVTLQDKGIGVPVEGPEYGGLQQDGGSNLDRVKKSVGRSGSLRWRDYGGRSDDEQETVCSLSGPVQHRALMTVAGPQPESGKKGIYAVPIVPYVVNNYAGST